MSGARFGSLAVVRLRTPPDGLPDLALADLCGQPVLARILARVRAAALVDETWGIVSDGPRAAPVLDFLRRSELPFRCVPDEDALEECLALAFERGVRHLVRVQGDRPFVDYDHVDLELGALRAFDADLVRYGADEPARRSGPLAGQWACSLRALRLAQASDDPDERAELGEPFLARHAAALRTVELELDARWARARACLALSTPDDLLRARALWSAIDHEGDGLFPLGRALRWLEAAPAPTMNRRSSFGYFRA